MFATVRIKMEPGFDADRDARVVSPDVVSWYFSSFPVVFLLLERLVLVDPLVPLLAPPNHYRGGEG